MRKTVFIILLLGIGCGFPWGCAEYHQDCHLLVISEPTGAEIWKGDYYIGKTPHLLCFTATKEDKKKGNLAVPPLVLKKKGYRAQPVETNINLEEGSNWECQVVLEPEAE